MIEVRNVVKKFDGVKALDGLNITVENGSIYGLVGTNGAGKTTIIKNIMGILKPDSGTIRIGGEPVFEMEEVKGKIGFVSDDLYFFPGYTLKEMGSYYSGVYPRWNNERFTDMTKNFALDMKKKLSSFSKGMQKQAAFILAMSTMPEYLVLDEPIDGLDPIVRLKVWKYIINDVAERRMTVLVSSHNLREMEGYCDHIGIISKGRMVIERDLEDLKSDVHKVQVAFREPQEHAYEDLNVLHYEKRGSVDLIIVRDKKEKVEEVIGRYRPAVFDMLPLSLEEIFIYELGGVSDEIDGII
ncbi:MAG: ABC transporter ATP-binding protein [Eubacteriaceae bacterium]|nr:ABC transporter ATP-binding protein [Eubacteriaceae bacterium]